MSLKTGLFDEDDDVLALIPLAGSRRVDPRDLKKLVYEKLERNFTQNPFDLPAGSDVVFDVECYINYFLVGFKHLDTGLYFYAEQLNGTFFAGDLVRRVLWHFRCIGFNSRSYDLPMIEAAMKGASD